MLHPGSVDLRTPANSDAARVVRMVAASVAVGSSLGYEKVDDTFVAANEAFTILIDTPGAESVECVFTTRAGSIAIEMKVDPPRSWPTGERRWASALGARILSRTASEVEYGSKSAEIRLVVGAADSV